jgi:hypothetical protein
MKISVRATKERLHWIYLKKSLMRVSLAMRIGESFISFCPILIFWEKKSIKMAMLRKKMNISMLAKLSDWDASVELFVKEHRADEQMISLFILVFHLFLSTNLL